MDPTKLELGSFRIRGSLSQEANITNFLTELWKEILQHLSSEDFLSLINCSPLIRNQRKDERAQMLLPMIIPILVTERFITTHQDFLQLRTFYSFAKQGLDNLLEKQYSPEKYWETITTRDLEWKEWMGDETLKLKRISNKVQQEYSHRFQMKVRRHLEQDQHPNLVKKFNPFLTGYFQVELDSILLGDHETFLKFMSTYGHHVVHLNCSLIRNIQFLFLLLTNLPNLKVLKLLTKLGNLQRLRVAKVGDHALSALSNANLPALQEIHFKAANHLRRIRLQQVLDVVNRFHKKVTCFQFYIKMEADWCRVKSLKKGSMIPLLNLTRFSTYASNVDFEWFWPFIQNKCPNLVDLNLVELESLTRHGFCEVTEDQKKKENDCFQMIQRIGFAVAPTLKRITLTSDLDWSWEPDWNAERVLITRDSIHSKTLRRLED